MQLRVSILFWLCAGGGEGGGKGVGCRGIFDLVVMRIKESCF